MIIHIPEFQTQEGKRRISVRVEYETKDAAFPDTLWIEVPEELIHGGPADQNDAFAAGLLLLAMSLGEDLEVRGRLCPVLAYGLERYQEIFLAWFPEVFRPVTIKPEKLASADRPAGGGLVCQAFSGGVDSFYTLHEHLPSIGQKPLKVTHAMMVHGFDVPLTDQKSFVQMTEAYGPILRDLEVRLLPVTTNLRQVTRKVNWEISHGSALAFAALASGTTIGSFIISSTWSYEQAMPWGSDSRSDHWLSSERTKMIHFGAHLTRSEKLSSLVEWKPVQNGLRVCWEKPDGLMNCCRCGKCLRTMMTLRMEGILEHFKTFPFPYDRQLARALPYDGESLVQSALALMDAARRKGDDEMMSDLQYALRRQRRRDLVGKVRKWMGHRAGQNGCR